MYSISEDKTFIKSVLIKNGAFDFKFAEMAALKTTFVNGIMCTYEAHPHYKQGPSFADKGAQGRWLQGEL